MQDIQKLLNIFVHVTYVLQNACTLEHTLDGKKTI